jgi:hypothetical protein
MTDAREKLGVFGLATAILVLIVGGAFLVGYMIGKMLL